MLALPYDKPLWLHGKTIATKDESLHTESWVCVKRKKGKKERAPVYGSQRFPSLSGQSAPPVNPPTQHTPRMTPETPHIGFPVFPSKDVRVDNVPHVEKHPPPSKIE